MIVAETLVYDHDEAVRVCAIWQRRLRLSDWDVEVKIVRKRQLVENRLAQISIEWHHKHAIIEMMDPIDWHDEHGRLQDHEFEIVHELLHLHTGAMHDDLDSRAEEQAINCIAGALIKAYRKESD